MMFQERQYGGQPPKKHVNPRNKWSVESINADYSCSSLFAKKRVPWRAAGGEWRVRRKTVESRSMVTCHWQMKSQSARLPFDLWTAAIDPARGWPGPDYSPDNLAGRVCPKVCFCLMVPWPDGWWNRWFNWAARTISFLIAAGDFYWFRTPWNAAQHKQNSPLSESEEEEKRIIQLLTSLWRQQQKKDLIRSLVSLRLPLMETDAASIGSDTPN